MFVEHIIGGALPLVHPKMGKRSKIQNKIRNARRQNFLGMPINTARLKLNRILLFEFVKRLELDDCFRCQTKIALLEDFTIDHKNAWENVDNTLYWDINNIAFSHHKCNSLARHQGVV